mgnify:CR=1 FL=1
MKAFLTVWVILVLALHQDCWLWTDKTLVFGFLPIGLAYHVGYSCLAAVTMAMLVRWAWPSHLEEAAQQRPSRDGTGRSSG